MFQYRIGDRIPLPTYRSALEPQQFADLLVDITEYVRQPDSPSLTIQIVAYQETDELFRCLDSLANQTDSDFEILLVDNGLDEDTRRLLSNSSLRHIRLTHNVGCSQGRNIGAAHAKGELVNFLDADGVVGPEHVATCKRLMQNPSIVAVRGKVQTFDPSSEIINSHYDLGAAPLPSIISCEGISVWRRADFLKTGGFDQALSGGEGPLLCYRMHAFYNYPLDAFQYHPDLQLLHDYHSDEHHLRQKIQNYFTQRETITRQFPLICNMERYYHAIKGPAGARNSSKLDSIREEVRSQFAEETQRYYQGIAEKRLQVSPPKRSNGRYDFTVVIPCYNLGEYVWTAVHSVLSQSLESFQIIVVDDCSDDPKTIEELTRIEQHCTLLRNTENLGVSATRNKGILAAQSEFILCLDADDFIEPSYLEKAFNIFNLDTSVGIVSTWMHQFGSLTSQWYPKDLVSLREALVNSPIPTASCFRRSAWEQVGGYDETLRGYEDWNLWIALLAVGWKVRVIQEFLFYYRVHPASKINNSNKNMEALLSKIISNHRSLYEAHMDYVLIARHRTAVQLRGKLAEYRTREDPQIINR